MPKSYKLPTINCKKCGHSWIPRSAIVYRCPGCNNPAYTVPKKFTRLDLLSNEPPAHVNVSNPFIHAV